MLSLPTKLKNALAHVILLCLFCMVFSPYHALMKEKLFADDASYLAHAFTLGLDHNLQYNDSVAEWKTQNQKAAAHPIGPGVLAAPFVTAFSKLDKAQEHSVLTKHAAFQYSWSFFGFVFGSVFFFIAGLYCYLKAAETLAFALSRKHLLFIASSFGILYYVLFRPVMGHSFEFFSIGLCFWASCKMVAHLNEPKAPYAYAFICALSLVFTLQIRPSDINVMLLPFIVFGFLWLVSESPMTKQELNKCFKMAGFGFLSLCLCFLPFLIINEQLYDMPYPSSTAMYGASTNPVPAIANFADFMNALMMLLSRIPQVFTICFSSEFGLAFSSAILLFGTCFLLYFILANLKKRFWLSLGVLMMVGLYIALPVTITIFWQSLGDAYGHRFLFCLFPLALLGYGFWHKQLTQKYATFQNYPLRAKLLQAVTISLCCYSLLGNALFGLNSDLMYKPGVTNAFGREGGSAIGYNIAVLQSAPKPSTWINLAATRVPGFFAVGLLDLFSVEVTELKLPGALSEKLDKFTSDYQHPPLQAYLQALLIGLFFVGSYIVFMRADKKAKQRHAS